MEGAKKILTWLTGAGYEAYLVGGAVRDLLMGREPHDFDIVTVARPDQVIGILTQAGASHANLVGKAFGVVVVGVDHKTYEVATYRREFYGAHAHRPEAIEYADSLEEDVLRRDFTVNGMAMDKDGRIIDLVGGQEDLKKKRLVTIGNPVDRFREDALRLFRACRFVAKLDFLPTKALLEAMPQAFDRVSGLSLERVRSELDQLLLEPAVAKGLDILVQSGLAACQCTYNDGKVLRTIDILPELSHLVDLPQEKDFHEFDAWYHTLVAVQKIAPDPILRWGALLHDVGKGLDGVRAVRKGRLTDWGHDHVGAQLARDLLIRLGYGKAFADRVAWLVKEHMKFHFFAQHGEADATRWVRKEIQSGAYRSQAELKEAFRQLAAVCAADIIACGKPHASTKGNDSFRDCLLDLVDQMPIHSRELHYDGRLISAVGKEAKTYMPYLLEQVRSGRIPNEARALLEALEKKKKRLEGLGVRGDTHELN